MQLPFDFQSLEQDLPKIAATSVLIPVLQWGVAQSWNFRRKARVSGLRKDISELNDFISKQKPLAGDPGVDQSIRIAEQERSRKIEELNNSFDPESAPRRKLARVLLFDKPRSFQALIARIVAYIVIISMLSAVYSDRHSLFDDNIFIVSLRLVLATFTLGLLFSFFYLLAFRANKVSGKHNERPRWRALTLLYRNRETMAAGCQVTFFLFALSFLDNLKPLEHWETLAQRLRVAIFPFLAMLFFWMMARHFDRVPAPPKVALPPTPTLDKTGERCTMK